jgi:uncharacterized protein
MDTRTHHPKQGRPDRSPAPDRGAARRVRHTMSAEGAWKGTVLALVVFTVLASGGMVEAAEGMPLGWQRTVALGLANGVDRAANLLSLNRPYDWASEQLGRTTVDTDFEFPAEPAAVPATTTTLPALRTPTTEQPLKLVVAGDSTAIGVGDRLKVAADEVPELDVDVQGKVATGLTRSDYFNWGARVDQIVRELDPEVLVFMVGANDTQAVLDPDGTVVAQYGTPEWTEAYRRRVAGIMDLAHGGGRRLVWVGQPHVGDPKIQKTVALANQLISEEAAKRPWVTYFDLASVVGGKDGAFSPYVTFDDGTTVKCYAGDGVHLSLQCLDRSMDALVPAVQDLYGAPAPTTTTTSPPAGAPQAGTPKAVTPKAASDKATSDTD